MIEIEGHAIILQEHVMEVDVFPDGKIIDADGNCSG
jgi:hypothetical protein